MAAAPHTWVIDVLEEDAAAVEIDGRQVTSLPRWLLPEGTREGDVLTVRHDRRDGKSTLEIEIDREEKERRLRASAQQTRRPPSGYPGGDIVL